ncbi:hypothetical protein LSAT2_006345, partial [Lamellibrachia satsuma]
TTVVSPRHHSGQSTSPQWSVHITTVVSPCHHSGQPCHHSGQSMSPQWSVHVTTVVSPRPGTGSCSGGLTAWEAVLVVVLMTCPWAPYCHLMAGVIH